MGDGTSYVFGLFSTMGDALKGERMLWIDWLFAGLAFVGVVLAIGKYAHTSKLISKDAHTCLCTRCAHFKPMEEEQ